MKLSPWPPPWMQNERWAYVLGWLIHRALCVVGWHAWAFDPDVSVPFYGSGHDQCLVCGLIRVDPCGTGL